MDKILFIEDDKNQLQILGNYLRSKGFEVLESQTGEEGIRLAETKELDLILMDYKLPDIEGIHLLKKLKNILPLTPIIVITAFGSIEMAITSLKQGAYHYLTKPINLEELMLLIERALKTKKLEEDLNSLRARLKEEELPEDVHIIAESNKMKELLLLVKKVATTDATVLILGESGTGKEIIAELIHKLSMRSKKSLVKVNCAAIPKGLLESELFGHEKGAFTGAYKAKTGLFEVADRGSIFLDEIGDMDLDLQAKLLRVLQNNTFTRVGGTKEISVDVRIIAATNRDLEQMVKDQRFREDLFWRLNVFALNIPPLRERREDIIPLANYFCEKFSKKYKKNIKGISKKGLENLLVYDFPGNVRELENIIERAVIMSDNQFITVDDLLFTKKDTSSIEHELFNLPLNESVKILEKMRIERALKQSGHIQTRAAELLGISERALRYKLRKLGLKS